MKLKYRVNNLDGLDETIANLYVKSQDGGFHLDVEGATSSVRLREFRDNNIKLQKQLAEFEGIDPNKYKEYKDQAEKADELARADAEANVKKMTDQQITDIVNSRVSSMKSEHDKKLRAAIDERDVAVQRHNGLLIDNAVTSAASEHGVQPTALTDLQTRIRSVFSVNDHGVPVIVGSDGQIQYDDSGAEPMSVSSYVKKLKGSGSAPHLFKQPTGSGATGSSSNGLDVSKMNPHQLISEGLKSLQ